MRLVHLALSLLKSIKDHAHVVQMDLLQRILRAMSLQKGRQFVALVHREAFTPLMKIKAKGSNQSVSFVTLERIRVNLD